MSQAFQIKHFEDIASTQIEAKNLALRGADPWTVVVADSQGKGHGKMGAGWYSPKGGLYFSIILPKRNLQDLQTITLMAAYVVADVVKNQFGVEPMIKLPNDVFLNGKKFCGILTENLIGSDVQYSVIGIGLDTNMENFPDDLKDIATSILKETRRTCDNDAIMKQIVQGIILQMEKISSN